MKVDNATVLKSRIDKILWGKVVANVLDGDCNERSFVLRSLTIGETNLVDNMYHVELRRAIAKGMSTDEELVELYKRDGLWTPDDDIYTTGLERKIEILKDQIENQYAFMTNKKKRAERELKNTRQELEDRRSLKRELFALSAENWAEEKRRRNIVMLSTQSLDESQFWPNVDMFMCERDLVLIFNLALAYYRQNVLETSEVREIARCSMWRYRWSVAKNGIDIFGKPISEWSDLQNALIYWSQYYDFVYDNPDRPDEDVISDDEACDKWYEAQIKKIKSERAESTKKIRPKKGGPKKFHQEQFVMVEPGDMESVKRVQEMNSPLVRAQLKEEQRYIKEKGGRVKEWDIRKQRYIDKQM